MLKEKGFTFDIAFTSVLKRAIKTLFFIQDELDLHWIPVIRHWRINERMYGALQGLNKSETAAKHGEDQVQVKYSLSKVIGSVSAVATPIHDFVTTVSPELCSLIGQFTGNLNYFLCDSPSFSSLEIFLKKKENLW